MDGQNLLNKNITTIEKPLGNNGVFKEKIKLFKLYSSLRENLYIFKGFQIKLEKIFTETIKTILSPDLFLYIRKNKKEIEECRRHIKNKITELYDNLYSIFQGKGLMIDLQTRLKLYKFCKDCIDGLRFYGQNGYNTLSEIEKSVIKLLKDYEIEISSHKIHNTVQQFLDDNIFDIKKYSDQIIFTECRILRSIDIAHQKIFLLYLVEYLETYTPHTKYNVDKEEFLNNLIYKHYNPWKQERESIIKWIENKAKEYIKTLNFDNGYTVAEIKNNKSIFIMFLDKLKIRFPVWTESILEHNTDIL